MDLDKLHKKLITAAKATAPSDQVPYAFEKRIMARLTAPLAVDVWAVWGRWLWRAVTPCMSVMAGLGVWVVATTHPIEPESPNLEQAIENTLLSSDDVAGE
jgi:hypothetical protein